MFCMFYVAEAMEENSIKDDRVCALHAMEEGAREELIEYLDRNMKRSFVVDSYCSIKDERRCPYVHRDIGEEKVQKE